MRKDVPVIFLDDEKARFVSLSTSLFCRPTAIRLFVDPLLQFA